MNILFIIYLLFFISFDKNTFTMSPQSSENKKDSSFFIEGFLNGIPVSDIKIDDLQENIPFYMVPTDKKKNPRDDFEYLSLIPSTKKEYVKSIRLLKNLDGKDEIEEFFNNQSYARVIVKLIYDGKENEKIFLLSSNSVVSSFEKTSDDFSRSLRKTKITALKSLEIENLKTCNC